MRGVDAFNVNAALTGSVNGEAGSDTLAGTQITNVTLASSDGTGFTGTATGTSGFTGIDVINGAGGGTLTGENVASTWALGATSDLHPRLGPSPLTITGFADGCRVAARSTRST